MLGDDSFIKGPAANTPRNDTIVTNARPYIHFFNANGGKGSVEYVLQLDVSPEFNSNDLIEYRNIPETPLVTGHRIHKGDELKDRQKYWFRVKAIDSYDNESSWMTCRFFVDINSNNNHEGIYRFEIKEVEGLGHGQSNLIEWVDDGPDKFWEGEATEEKDQILIFDLGEVKRISKIWMLSDKKQITGRPKDYIWSYSLDGNEWEVLEETEVRDADAFRNIITFKNVVEARYLKLTIFSWHGETCKIAEIIPFGPRKPYVPCVPDEPYVVIVDLGYTGQSGRNAFVNSISYLEEELQLKQVCVPYFEFNNRWLSELPRPPLAILYSGFFRWFEDMPMFEFNGLFEVLRKAKIPSFGSCGGMHIAAMMYGYTFVRDMGCAVRKPSEIEIIKDDPLFENISNRFVGYESHAWEAVNVPEYYDVIAISRVNIESSKDKIEKNKMKEDKIVVEAIKLKDKFVYGTQFHPENGWKGKFLEALEVLRTFLIMVKKI